MLEWVIPGKKGPWEIRHYEVTREQAVRDIISNYGSYSIPVSPGWFTGLFHEKRGVVMSDTRQELIMMSTFRQRLHQKHDFEWVVHINGLGLGLCAHWALELGYKVYVCEIDQNVIDLTAPALWNIFGKDQLTIIHDNALEYRPIKGYKYYAVYHDIWDETDQENWEQYKLLHRRWGRSALWQDSWGRDDILRMFREDRKWR